MKTILRFLVVQDSLNRLLGLFVEKLEEILLSEPPEIPDQVVLNSHDARRVEGFVQENLIKKKTKCCRVADKMNWSTNRS